MKLCNPEKEKDYLLTRRLDFPILARRTVQVQPGGRFFGPTRKLKFRARKDNTDLSWLFHGVLIKIYLGEPIAPCISGWVNIFSGMRDKC
jgi:hypothetical protein